MCLFPADMKCWICVNIMLTLVILLSSPAVYIIYHEAKNDPHFFQAKKWYKYLLFSLKTATQYEKESSQTATNVDCRIS